MARTKQRARGSGAGAPVAFEDEQRLLDALRGGDEAAFMWLVGRHNSALLRLARMYVSSRVVAEEVVQETWLGVLKGIDRFEGRASLKTWIFRILMNVAKTRGQREARSIPFSSVWSARADPGEPAVDPDRFHPAGHPHEHRWAVGPTRLDVPEDSLLAREAEELVLRAIGELPAAQRDVITLRDVEGWSSREVCNALEISETNQRVLLHRARSKVRAALESYFATTDPAS